MLILMIRVRCGRRHLLRASGHGRRCSTDPVVIILTTMMWISTVESSTRRLRLAIVRFNNAGALWRLSSVCILWASRAYVFVKDL